MESMGDAMLVHFMVEEQILTAKLDASVEGKIEDEVIVKVDPASLHIFDGESEERVN